MIDHIQPELGKWELCPLLQIVLDRSFLEQGNGIAQHHVGKAHLVSNIGRDLVDAVEAQLFFDEVLNLLGQCHDITNESFGNLIAPDRLPVELDNRQELPACTGACRSTKRDHWLSHCCLYRISNLARRVHTRYLR